MRANRRPRGRGRGSQRQAVLFISGSALHKFPQQAQSRRELSSLPGGKMQRETKKVWKSPRAVALAPFPIPIHPAAALTTILSLEEEPVAKERETKRKRKER